MTTELEEQFYKAFGVEPIKYILPLGQNFYWQDGSRIMQEADYKIFKIIENDLTEEDKKMVKFIYPEITNDILLQMICINSQKGGIEIFNTKNFEELKNSMLQHCIDRLCYALNKEQYKAKIQQLFKEEENE